MRRLYNMIHIPFCFTVSYISIEDGSFCLFFCASLSSSNHCSVLSSKCVLRALYASELASRPASKRFHLLRSEGTFMTMSGAYELWDETYTPIRTNFFQFEWFM